MTDFDDAPAVAVPVEREYTDPDVGCRGSTDAVRNFVTRSKVGKTT
jgi:hypothetical protein